MDNLQSKNMDRPSWLYIIFIHDFNNTQPDVFETIKNDLQQQIHSASVKIILVKNSLLFLRDLSSEEIDILGGNKKKLYFCQTTIYESEIDNDLTITINPINKLFNYWQEAFDFVLANYKADNYVLHSQSHSNGFEINRTDEGFVLNGCNNLMQQKNNSPAHQNQFFKNYLFLFKTAFTAFTTSLTPKPYLAINSSGVPLSPNVSFTATNSCGVGIF